MRKIYLIESSYFDKTNQKLQGFHTVYAVGDEITARNDCKRFQIKNNTEYEECSFKFIYRYRSIEYYEF